MKIAVAGRLAFTDLFAAVKVGDDPNSKPRFGCITIVEPPAKCVIITEERDGDGQLVKKIRTPSTIAEVVALVAKEKWKDKANGVLGELKKKDRVCYVPGPKTNKSGDVYDGFLGMHHIRAGNEAKPLVLNRNKSPLTAQDGVVYAGCYANVTLDVWAQDNKWGQRINATLLGVQFDRDGDAFSGGAPSDESDFDDLGEGSNADNGDDLA